MMGTSMVFERNKGDPAEECLTTMASAPRAFMFMAVSLSVSPLVRLLDVPEIDITSAHRLLAAISKAILVLVLGSRKRLTILFPFRYRLCSSGLEIFLLKTRKNDT